MNITPDATTISRLLGSRCQFLIPRFQRDYSWETKHYQEFLDDMLNCIGVEGEEIVDTSYFLGTMLFVGRLDKPGGHVNVVDGQQRLTTITILFSAISDHFIQNGNEKLSEKIFNYIMTEDDNGENVKILKSDTSFPFFQYYIQDRQKQEKSIPSSEEEECIRNAYEYLYKRTSEEELKNYLSKRLDATIIEKTPYEKILVTIRDQVTKSTVVTICTQDKQESNIIFEILNGKGKRLASVDLIKNEIFDVLCQTEPVDFAQEKWNKMKNHLFSGNNTVGAATFFRHYWISKYGQSAETTLYTNFQKKINKNQTEYKGLLDDLVKNAEYYSKILNPSREHYENKKEYYWLVQSLKILSDDFNIVQIRILLMALFDARERDILKMKDFKSLIYYLEGFHFVYNALLGRRTNVLEAMYSKHARNIRKCQSSEEVKIEISALYKDLDKYYPAYLDFHKAFINLSYSKKGNPDNLKVKYAINKLNVFYSNNGQEVFPDEGSMEHILPEAEGSAALNIGNLILLEKKLNEDADRKEYGKKREEEYSRSSYVWIKEFIKAHNNWQVEDIKQRAEDLAKVFYYDILKRNNR